MISCCKDRRCTPLEPETTSCIQGTACLYIRRTANGTELIVSSQETCVTPMLACVATFAAAFLLAVLFPDYSPVRLRPNTGPGLLQSDEPATPRSWSWRTMTPALLLLVLLLLLLFELSRVKRESIRILPGGVGYLLESERRCGVVSHRFIDSRDVEYVTLSEAVTSSDVHFFLAFALRPEATSGDSAGGLAVPYQHLLPHMRLRMLRAIYRELVASAPPRRLQAESAPTSP
ncbi:hypothetical protein Agub_g7180 [Astrephomene gubernaculifera]|uniref:GPI-GlcNAc transferase complex PIG-H component conserved domain-containing protein n=1 Tax=Astrephomene gubernaculifera TaxID=47775 RepID=A0AAD3DQ39_9CHLO|nr:hypothetical protein Agub_g7180 [Astrephomene gubernaculifera]